MQWCGQLGKSGLHLQLAAIDSYCEVKKRNTLMLSKLATQDCEESRLDNELLPTELQEAITTVSEDKDVIEKSHIQSSTTCSVAGLRCRSCFQSAKKFA